MMKLTTTKQLSHKPAYLKHHRQICISYLVIGDLALSPWARLSTTSLRSANDFKGTPKRLELSLKVREGG
jgi:hypothetical protein